MHGSTHHLLGPSPTQLNGPSLTGRREVVHHGGGASGGETFSTYVLSTTQVGRTVEALSRDCDPIPEETEEPQEAEEVRAAPATWFVDDLRGGVRDLLRSLDAEHAARGELGVAPWTRGYARVTAVLPAAGRVPGCLVASPLTVEYAQDLP